MEDLPWIYRRSGLRYSKRGEDSNAASTIGERGREHPRVCAQRE